MTEFSRGRGVFAPISRQSVRVLSLTLHGERTAIAAAARSPSVALFVPDLTTPFSILIVDSLTFQLRAAAVTNMARAAAPIRRICIQASLVDVDPPVTWSGMMPRMTYSRFL